MKNLMLRFFTTAILTVILVGTVGTALGLLTTGVAVAGISVGRKKPPASEGIYRGLRNDDQALVASAIERAEQEGWEVDIQTQSNS